MFRLIVAIACLLIIDEFTLGLRRRYLEHRQLRWWEKRIVRLPPARVAAQATSLDPIFKLSPEEEVAMATSEKEAAETRKAWDEVVGSAC